MGWPQIALTVDLGARLKLQVAKGLDVVLAGFIWQYPGTLIQPQEDTDRI